MKKYLVGLFLLGVITACNNSNSGAELKDPSTVQPPSEAIPDSTELVNEFGNRSGHNAWEWEAGG